MVLADVPTGLYADRHGAKAALRLGLQMTCLIMLGFFLLGLWRAMAVARGVAPGSWLPGIVGLLVLEGAIGVSLALLSGADTVLFLAVAQRSGIAGLDRSGFEGVGSAIRYFGTMVAVVVGALLYDGIGVIVRQYGPCHPRLLGEQPGLARFSAPPRSIRSTSGPRCGQEYAPAVVRGELPGAPWAVSAAPCQSVVSSRGTLAAPSGRGARVSAVQLPTRLCRALFSDGAHRVYANQGSARSRVARVRV